MSKSVLLVIGLAALVSASSLRVSDAESQENYFELQQFLGGFMTGYTGAPADMTNCLTPATQDYLNQLLGSTYLYMFSEQIIKIKEAYIEYLNTLSNACKECGLGRVSDSLKEGVTEKGKIWFDINLAFNFDKLEPAFAQIRTEISKGQYTEAGSTLGKLTALLVPYQPTPIVHSSLQFNTEDYKNWWKGLVKSLSVNTKRQGPCALFLLNFGNSSAIPVSDIDKILNNDKSGFQTIFGDFAQLLTSVQSYNGVCMFDLLFSNIQDIATKDGLVELGSRYVARAITINAAVGSIRYCSSNTYSCGQGYGTIIKFMLNWSIN